MTAQALARGLQLRTWRRARGWSQERLALAAELSPRAVFQLEHGQRVGRPATWIALADALEVHPLDLLATPAVEDGPR